MALQPAACLAQLSAAGGLPLLLAFFQAQMSALPNVLKLGTQHNEALASFAAIEHCCHLLKYLRSDQDTVILKGVFEQCLVPAMVLLVHAHLFFILFFCQYFLFPSSEYSEEAVAVITAHKLPLLLADCIRPSDFPHSLCQAAGRHRPPLASMA